MTTHRCLAVELRNPPRALTLTLVVSPPWSVGDVFRGKAIAHGHVICTSIGLPTALATFESLRAQMAGFGYSGIPEAEELMRVASTTEDV